MWRGWSSGIESLVYYRAGGRCRATLHSSSTYFIFCTLETSDTSIGAERLLVVNQCGLIAIPQFKLLALVKVVGHRPVTVFI